LIFTKFGTGTAIYAFVDLLRSFDYAGLSKFALSRVLD